MARREPMMRLNNVDLPTFGRPTMAIVGSDTVLADSDFVLKMFFLIVGTGNSKCLL